MTPAVIEIGVSYWKNGPIGGVYTLRVRHGNEIEYARYVDVDEDRHAHTNTHTLDIVEHLLSAIPAVRLYQPLLQDMVDSLEVQKAEARRKETRGEPPTSG